MWEPRYLQILTTSMDTLFSALTGLNLLALGGGASMGAGSGASTSSPGNPSPAPTSNPSMLGAQPAISAAPIDQVAGGTSPRGI